MLTFFGAVVVLGVLRADVGLLNGFVSDYANGRVGWLFTIGLLTHAAGNLAIAAGLALELGPGRAARFGVLFFALAGVGLLTAGLFPTDPDGAPASAVGLVHSTAVTASFPVELLALLLLASAFRARPAWRAYVRRSLQLTAVAGAATLWFLVAVLTDWAPGLAERGALATLMVWELSTALRLATHVSRTRGRAAQGNPTPREPGLRPR